MLPSSSTPAGSRYYCALENYRIAVERLANVERNLESAKTTLAKAHADLTEAVEGLMKFGRKEK